VNEQLAWIRGKHSLKFGFQYLLAKYARFDCNGCSGEIAFSTAATGNPGISSRTGSSYAAFLLGLASGNNFNYSANIEFFFPYYAWYVQDDWKLTSKLTLNLGLRYEISYPKQESNFQNSNFNPSIPNPGAGGILGAFEFAGSGPGRSGKSRFQDTRYNGLGPRIGIAYQLTPSTVLRAGSAIYYQAMREDGNADNGVQGFGGRFNALADYLATGISFRLSNGLNEFGNQVQVQKPPRIDPGASALRHADIYDG
jgi:outer membrane receptor protein involved in Fe transport